MHIDLPGEKKLNNHFSSLTLDFRSSNLCCIEFWHGYVDIECVIFVLAICRMRLFDHHQNGADDDNDRER